MKTFITITDAKPSCRLFALEIKKAARLVLRLSEVFSLIGGRILEVKSTVNKALKKVKDDEAKKQLTALLKETNSAIKTEAESMIALHDNLLTASEKRIMQFKEGRSGIFETVQKHPLMQVVNDGNIIKKNETFDLFEDAMKRNYVFIMSILMGKIKERAKVLKALSA